MFSFIIPICIQQNLHLNQLKRCIESVIKYHIDSNIYLINDSDDSFNLLIQNYIKYININNTVYIIIQDSMFLNRALDNIEKVESINFLWYFTNHRMDWDKILEPESDFNKINNIKTHTDLIRHHLINNYIEDINFLNYYIESLKNKNNWVGCFGNCCIITKKCLDFLNKNTNFVKKFINNTTNRERRMNESIFSLMCHYYFPQNYENAYDGLYYDGINVNEYSNKPTGFDNLKYCCRKKYISKISFCR
jgi:hypothetical protein